MEDCCDKLLTLMLSWMAKVLSTWISIRKSVGQPSEKVLASYVLQGINPSLSVEWLEGCVDTKISSKIWNNLASFVSFRTITNV